MNKKKIAKTIFVVLFIVIAGVFYSCSADNDDKVTLIANTKEDDMPDDTKDTLVTEVDTKDSKGSKSTIDSSKTEDIEAESIDVDGIDADSKSKENMNSNDKSSEYIYVHVCGEVKKPDVYRVEDDTRVYEAIAKAGGLTDQAAAEYINQALVVSDGQQLYIPSIDEVKDTLPKGITSALTDGTNLTNKEGNTQDNVEGAVNINVASMDELMTLSGIGQAKAQAIIDYRTSNKGFKTIDEIKNIDGIKDAVFNKIKDKIQVN